MEARFTDAAPSSVTPDLIRGPANASVEKSGARDQVRGDDDKKVAAEINAGS